MDVFITGIAGFLGTHLAEHLLGAGHNVRGIDNLSGGDRDLIPSGADFFVKDCLNRQSYQDLLEGASVVFHCAAAPYDGLSVFAPAHVFKNTAQATAEVASASANTSVSRIVYCSSMAGMEAPRHPSARRAYQRLSTHMESLK